MKTRNGWNLFQGSAVYMVEDDNYERITNMRLKEKIGIFLAATLLTLIGFSFMAAPTVDMMKIGKQAGYEMIANYLAKADSVAPRS
jgi:hypothetical protein